MEFKPEIMRAIQEMGFVDLTDIQRLTIPLLLEGRDVIGHSHTGTGKTAAFGIPILETIDFSLPELQALIICPTRELAVQIQEEMLRMAKYLEGFRIVTVFGGDPLPRQITLLKKRPQIVVGTPGRTLDHLNRHTLKLGELRYLVLDEADEMLKMGFQEDIEKIIAATPATRQTLMFSATMPKWILHLAKTYMIDPELVKVIGPESTNADVIQYYYKVKREHKTEALYRLINVYRPKLSLIFCNTKVKVDELTQELIERGVNCDKIHGDLPQTTRLDVLKKFHAGIIDVMVATDVAARGLDIKAVEAVFNYDVPEKADYYVHRIGRTGRIGNIGYSFTLVSYGELKQIEEIERITNTRIKKRNIPTYDKVLDVKNEKLVAKMKEIITENDDFASEYAVLNQAIQAQLREDQIIVSLLRMLRRSDGSTPISADINEEFESKPKSAYAKGAGAARFHLNLGKQDNLTINDIIAFVSESTGINRAKIQDIAILTEFSFFTVSGSQPEAIRKTLENRKLRGKTVTVRVAYKPRKRLPYQESPGR